MTVKRGVDPGCGDRRKRPPLSSSCQGAGRRSRRRWIPGPLNTIGYGAGDGDRTGWVGQRVDGDAGPPQPGAPAPPTPTGLRRRVLQRPARRRVLRRRAARPPAAPSIPAQAPPGPDVTERVRTVVGAVAPLLGLDPARVPVTVRGGAGRPHGAARHDGLVFTGWLDPALPPGRSLIVHELAHLRQHRNAGGAKGARAPDVTAAEAEAGGLAAAVREGRPLWVPQQVLPGGHVARDTGASGVAVATTAPTTPTLERDLEALAAQNHLDNVLVIADQLDPRQGAQSKSTGENSLRALSALQFVVARALVRSLRPPIRLRLAGVQDEHHAKYPEACVAVLSALTADELRLLPAPADRAAAGGRGRRAARRRPRPAVHDRAPRPAGHAAPAAGPGPRRVGARQPRRPVQPVAAHATRPRHGHRRARRRPARRGGAGRAATEW